MHAKSLQSRLTLCNPVDCSLPGSSVHGTLQRNLLNPEIEPVSPAAPVMQEDSLPLSHRGSPNGGTGGGKRNIQKTNSKVANVKTILSKCVC